MAVLDSSSAIANDTFPNRDLDQDQDHRSVQGQGPVSPESAQQQQHKVGVDLSPNSELNFENGNENVNGSPNYDTGSSSSGGGGSSSSSDGGQENGFDHRRSIRELADLFSKLNPDAAEFIPPSYIDGNCDAANGIKSNNNRKKKNGYPANKRRSNSRLQRAQRDDSIRRTVYVSDIDQQVTEEQLAALFHNCGQVVDCRVCGDPNSVLRFAFVEFTEEDGARNALSLAGTMLGFYPVRVLPSKTAIMPVNPTFLPQSEDEREMCARTVYCTNIDKKLPQERVKSFFESMCGEVSRLRLLGDYRHSTRIAFVEFIMADSAIAALNCSGAVLGTLPIRVSPSKTPVRPCLSRPFYI